MDFRIRVFAAPSRAALLLALTGLAAAGLETVSSGHGHFSGGHAVFHHHLYAGPHEHPDDHEAPAPHDCDPPRHTATVSAAPVLFQPAAASVLAAPPADPAPVVPAPAPPRVERPAARLVPPRAPPASLTAPDFLS